MNRTLIMRVVSEDIQREFLSSFPGVTKIVDLPQYGFDCQVFDGSAYTTSSRVKLSWTPTGYLLIELWKWSSDQSGLHLRKDVSCPQDLKGLADVIDRVIFNTKEHFDEMKP